ncbi:MAG: amidase, partial [Deltaproteobacteria bacterium]|nr:amidase [Deltaproteobacteria bacterium]
EFYAVKGLPSTGGIVRRQFHRAEKDSTAVQRLRTAGAIVLGITNAPEGGLWSETNNRVYGRTNNPWDLKRTPGGSSGGEAAIIAAGGAPFGLGSDLGGSIRIPSALCGIASHKPTGWLVPGTGHFPEMTDSASRLQAFGPMVRRVEDLMPLLRILAGPDGVDPNVRETPLGDPDAVDLSGVRVFFIEDPPRPKLQPAVREAVQRAAKALENRGATVEPWTSPKLRRVFGMWSAILETESTGSAYREMLGDGKPVGLRWELLKYPLGRSEHISIALGLMLLESALKWMPKGSKSKLVREAAVFQRELEDLLGEDGVLLHAPYRSTALRHHEMLLKPFGFLPTALFNVVEFPATTVPLGFDDRGLPLGVQVAARRGNDHLTIAVARSLEDLFGGWVRAEPTAR